MIQDGATAWIRADVQWRNKAPDMLRLSGVNIRPTKLVDVTCDGVPLGRIDPVGPRDVGLNVKFDAGAHRCEAKDEHGSPVGEPFSHTFEATRDYTTWAPG